MQEWENLSLGYKKNYMITQRWLLLLIKLSKHIARVFNQNQLIIFDMKKFPTVGLGGYFIGLAVSTM